MSKSKYDTLLDDSYGTQGRAKNYDEPGDYLQLITVVKEVPKAKGVSGGHTFTIVFEKVNLWASEDAENKAGSLANDVVKSDNQFFQARTTGTIAAILGLPLEELSGSDLEEAVSADQPISNLVVPCRVYAKETKAKNIISVCEYGQALTWAEVAERVDAKWITQYFPEGLPTDAE